MKAALALILCVLVLLGGVSYIEWQLHKAESAAATATTELKAARDANQSQALALATLEADRAADQQQLAALADQLTLIEAQRNTTRSAFAQVVAHATPADKDLLNSKLPAATVQLFRRSTATVDPSASNPPVHP
ncbi:hypothetical protein [Pseudomonas fluorescens group sp. PF-69]